MTVIPTGPNAKHDRLMGRRAGAEAKHDRLVRWRSGMEAKHDRSMRRRSGLGGHANGFDSFRARTGCLCKHVGDRSHPDATAMPIRSIRSRPDPPHVNVFARGRARALYSAVCAKPGETMMFLAAQLEATPRQLKRPVAQLKRAGRVRSAWASARTRVTFRWSAF
jgi:hypothetical protein